MSGVEVNWSEDSSGLYICCMNVPGDMHENLVGTIRHTLNRGPNGERWMVTLVGKAERGPFKLPEARQIVMDSVNGHEVAN